MKIQKHGLPPIKRKILVALIKAGERGLNVNELAEAIYKDREDGGPEWACSVINKYKKLINRILPEGMRIIIVGRTQSARYVLVYQGEDK